MKTLSSTVAGKKGGRGLGGIVQTARFTLAAGLLLSVAQIACAQLAVGDRVNVGSTGEGGIVIELGAPQSTGGVMVKVHLDRLGAANPNVGVWYDSALSKVVADRGAAQNSRGTGQRESPATHDKAQGPAPNQTRAPQSSGGACKVGDRVAMPAGYQDKWFDAVVVAVDPSKPYPCRVHPLGYADTMNESFSPSMLKVPGTVKTEPVGNLTNDPQLLSLQGKRAFKPSKVLEGAYECYALSAGRLSPSMALNFRILGGGRYTDVAGASGTYTFDAASGAMVFEGAALNGQRANYAQPSNPPSRNTPPNVTFVVSGDSCDMKV
jgi:hypothetical protein